MKLTKTQAAARISSSEKTLERLINAGKIRAAKVNGRLEILDSDINAFLSQYANAPTAGAGVHGA